MKDNLTNNKPVALVLAMWETLGKLWVKQAILKLKATALLKSGAISALLTLCFCNGFVMFLIVPVITFSLNLLPYIINFGCVDVSINRVDASCKYVEWM